MMMVASRILRPGPPCSRGTPSFIRPALKANSHTSRGKISFSSYSRARGIISRSANSRARRRRSDCSSVRSKPIIFSCAPLNQFIGGPNFPGLPACRFLREAQLKRKGDNGRRRDALSKASQTTMTRLAGRSAIAGELSRALRGAIYPAKRERQGESYVVYIDREDQGQTGIRERARGCLSRHDQKSAGVRARLPDLHSAQVQRGPDRVRVVRDLYGRSRLRDASQDRPHEGDGRTDRQSAGREAAD